MCVIAVCKNNLPNEHELQMMEAANPHGGGVAWVEDGAVSYLKGVTATKIWDLIKSGRIVAPAIFHFRIGTVGGNTNELCHPFPVTSQAGLKTYGTANAVLFHNGHWSDWEKAMGTAILSNKRKLPSGPWSDSRAMAYLAHHYGVQALSFLISSSQKVAILKPKEIILLGHFMEYEQRFKVSNFSWELKAIAAEASVKTSGKGSYFGSGDGYEGVSIYDYEKKKDRPWSRDSYNCKTIEGSLRRERMMKKAAEEVEKMKRVAEQDTKDLTPVLAPTTLPALIPGNDESFSMDFCLTEEELGKEEKK